MIHLFDNSRRTLLFPVNWANSVVRWIQGVHSPSGTLTIKNELNPGECGSVQIDVNVKVVADKVAAAMSNIILKKADVLEILEQSVDGVSIISPGGQLKVSEDWIRDSVARYSQTPSDLTHDDITDWDSATADFLDSDDYDALEGAIDDLSDVVDGILADYLSSADIGVSVAAQNHTHSNYAASDHTHSGYASSSHSHGNITSDGKLSGCTSADCLLVTTTGGLITHSNSSPKASDVASLVSQWISNGRTIGGGSIDHTKITDWASATAGFLDSDDYDALSGAIGDLADIVDGCLFQADIGVSVAAKNHSHTTANITDWSTATASFVTDADLSAYALDSDLAVVEGALSDLTDVVDGILADYVTSADLADYITTDEIPANFLTAIASRKSGSFTFLADVQFNGTSLQKKTQTITVTQGVVTNIGTASGWSTWHTPTVITWS